ncbi:hypothetical protein GCM10010399_27200 [Dactylosporangium fulvum]
MSIGHLRVPSLIGAAGWPCSLVLHPAERGSESQGLGGLDGTSERGRNLRAVDINGAVET